MKKKPDVLYQLPSIEIKRSSSWKIEEPIVWGTLSELRRIEHILEPKNYNNGPIWESDKLMPYEPTP